MSQEGMKEKKIYDIKNQNFVSRKGQMQNKCQNAIKVW